MINSLAMSEDAERLDNYHVDKSKWGDGPWQSEPDRVQWRTAAGFPGLIVRSNPHLGILCGYVGVPPEHPFHGLEYGELPADISVHGGLTYSDRCMDDGPVCHIPESGDPADIWWLGFDCGHGFDLVPGMAATQYGQELSERLSRLVGREVYRDIAYVRSEVESLAEQLAAFRS